ncbi:hypothetical protein [Phormidesmis sp. 146-33]
MPVHQEHLLQDWKNQLQKKSFIQRYLRSPLSISWSKLSMFFQSPQPIDEGEFAEAEQPLREVYFARVANAPSKGIRVQGHPSLTAQLIYILYNGDDVTVFLEQSLHEKQLQWVQVQFGFEVETTGWVAAEVLGDWELDRLVLEHVKLFLTVSDDWY